MRTVKQGFSDRNLPFGGLVAFSLLSPLSIAGANAAWVAAFLLWLYKIRYQDPSRPLHLKRTELDPGLALFVLASLLSLWVSLSPLDSLLELRSLGLMVIYFLFSWNVHTSKERRCLVYCLLGSASLAALYGIFQFFTGWDFLGHYNPDIPRASGFFGLHLTFGEYLMLTTCVLMGLVLWTKPESNRSYFKSHWAVLLAGGLITLLMVLAIVLSWAKGAELGLLAGGCVVLGLRGKKALLAGIGAGMLLFLLVLLLVPEAVTQNVSFFFGVDSAPAAGPAASNTQRLYMWWSGFRISAGHFLFGVGPHAVEAVYPDFRHALAADPNQWHLHNQFVQIGVTRGLFGLSGLLLIFVLAFRAGRCRLRHCADPWDQGLAAGVLGALTAFLVSGLTEYCWGDSEILMAVYMLLGLMISIPVPSQVREGITGREEPGPTGLPLSRFRPALAGSLLVLLLAVLVILPFLLPPAGKTVRWCLLQATLGGVLVGVAASRSSEGRPAVLWEQRVVACLMTFAGYALARPLWLSGRVPLFGSMPVVVIIAVSCALVAWLLIPIQGHRRQNVSSHPSGLSFDTAVLGAFLLWAVMGLGTNLLLCQASVGQALWGPPLTVLLPLCLSSAVLYGSGRVLYTGGMIQRIMVAILGVCLILNSLR